MIYLSYLDFSLFLVSVRVYPITASAVPITKLARGCKAQNSRGNLSGPTSRRWVVPSDVFHGFGSLASCRNPSVFSIAPGHTD